MACDICGKVGTELADLLTSYQTAEIKAICPSCEKIINTKNGKLLDLVLNIKRKLFVEFITQLRGSYK